MPVLASTADVVTRHLPKLFSPRAHRAADYAMGAAFAVAGIWFWRRNRRAALASWICGGSILSLTELTSYPGQGRRLVGYDSHEKLELAIAALVATMPEFLDLDDNRTKRYFRTQAGILTVISNLTSFRASMGKK
jgi:hypothetical protein